MQHDMSLFWSVSAFLVSREVFGRVWNRNELEFEIINDKYNRSWRVRIQGGSTKYFFILVTIGLCPWVYCDEPLSFYLGIGCAYWTYLRAGALINIFCRWYIGSHRLGSKKGFRYACISNFSTLILCYCTYTNSFSWIVERAQVEVRIVERA